MKAQARPNGDSPCSSRNISRYLCLPAYKKHQVSLLAAADGSLQNPATSLFSQPRCGGVFFAQARSFSCLLLKGIAEKT